MTAFTCPVCRRQTGHLLNTACHDCHAQRMAELRQKDAFVPTAEDDPVPYGAQSSGQYLSRLSGPPTSRRVIRKNLLEWEE